MPDDVKELTGWIQAYGFVATSEGTYDHDDRRVRVQIDDAAIIVYVFDDQPSQRLNWEAVFSITSPCTAVVSAIRTALEAP